MIEFPVDYKLRTERDFFKDCLVFERLHDFQKNLSHAYIGMGTKIDGQTFDDMFTEKYHIWRVYDIDGITKYKLNTLFVERKDHAKMIDDLFRKRNTPSMHIKHSWHLIKNPPLGIDNVTVAILALCELPNNLKMCKLNKTR